MMMIRVANLGHLSIVLRVDHVLTKETSGNRLSAVIWSISTSCMLISQRISFTPQCHDFYARDSPHYKLMEWNLERNRLVCRHAQTEHSHCSANPTRTVRVIFFPINAPGMGRLKLLDLVGYS